MLNSTKTWQEDFGKQFNGIINSSFECCDAEKLFSDIKQFISDLIAQTREETIREVEDSNKDYLKKLCWTGKDIEYFMGQYNKLKK